MARVPEQAELTSCYQKALFIMVLQFQIEIAHIFSKFAARTTWLVCAFYIQGSS